MERNEVRGARTTAKNLRLLAAHLEGKEVQMCKYFGDDYEFTAYVVHFDGEVERNWCGTSACAMGWATTHPDMPVLPEHFYDCGGLSMDAYRWEYFPAPYTYDKVFSSTLPDEGAAQRCIDWAEELEKGHA